MFLYMVYMYVCVYVCVLVRGFGAHTGHGSRGLTLSILLNGKPICEHFSSQRSRRLILEWVGLIHRLPPPGFAFTTISIAINVSVPSSSADWRGRIHDSCVGLACTTRPYTCYHSREIHMDAPSVYAWSARTYRCVVSNGCREREPTLYELVFCLLENAMNVLTRGYVYRRSKGLCVFRGYRDVLK